MKKARFPGFAKCMQMMRKWDGGTREDGFQALLPRAAEFLPDLIAAFRVEEDHGLRCWLPELIGEARDPRALEILVENLNSRDEAFRRWAIEGLKDLNSHEARKPLFEAGIPYKKER